LTYALVWEGLRPGDGGKLKADLNGDGVVTLEEWLKYGEQRTPSLYEDAKAGKVKMVSRTRRLTPHSSTKPPNVLKPLHCSISISEMTTSCFSQNENRKWKTDLG